MRIASFLLLFTSLLYLPLLGGDFDHGKSPLDAKDLSIEPEGWETNFYIPGFLPWLNSTVGVRGVEASTTVGIDTILRNTEMLALAGLEGRKGKLGYIIEGIYLDLGVSGNTPGRLLSSVDMSLQNLIAEGAVTYRLHESKKGFIELLVGARYYYLAAELDYKVSSTGVAAVSEDISAAVVSRSVAAVKNVLDRRLDAILANLTPVAADIRAQDLNLLDRRANNDVDGGRAEIQEGIADGLLSSLTGDGISVGNNPVVRRLVKDYVRARLELDIEARRAAASATVATARAGARARAQRALDRAERKLAQGIQSRINQRLSRGGVDGSQGWVDPFIGLRGKVLLTDDVYLIARGDYGGFGVSSDQIYNVYGAIGTKVKENITLEIGIRHMGVDYEGSGGFLYDASYTGPFLGTIIHF
ncbi:MAG: hypothetical protein AAGC68_09770 [Verrucomicrobiota bacterium]